jgi:hypothetical protein
LKIHQPTSVKLHGYAQAKPGHLIANILRPRRGIKKGHRKTQKIVTSSTMASGTGPTLAHRTVTSIRGGPSQGSGPSAPHTPTRSSITSIYGSPSAVRADDDIIIIELGSRHIRVGFAGDTSPKATLQCSPEDQRRAGDFRGWQLPKRSAGLHWSKEHEFWRYDLRDIELGLYQDKLERVLHDAFSK